MRVLAAMSGGVDSAVATARLVSEGHEVVGVHLALSKNAEAYRSGARSATEAVATLRQMKEATPWRHVFWAEKLSMTDSQAIYAERIAGAKQVTDVYLAALALRNAGRLVTFDSRVPWQAVASGTARLIEIPVR